MIIRSQVSFSFLDLQNLVPLIWFLYYHCPEGCSAGKCLPLLGRHHESPTCTGTNFPKLAKMASSCPSICVLPSMGVRPTGITVEQKTCNCNRSIGHVSPCLLKTSPQFLIPLFCKCCHFVSHFVTGGPSPLCHKSSIPCFPIPSTTTSIEQWKGCFFFENGYLILLLISPLLILQ